MITIDRTNAYQIHDSTVMLVMVGSLVQVWGRLCGRTAHVSTHGQEWLKKTGDIMLKNGKADSLVSLCHRYQDRRSAKATSCRGECTRMGEGDAISRRAVWIVLSGLDQPDHHPTTWDDRPLKGRQKAGGCQMWSC